MEANLGNTWHHTKRVTNREEIIEECKFMVRFEPLSLERAKTICHAIEEFLIKYPFLLRIMEKEGEAMSKEMRNKCDRQGVQGLRCKKKERRMGKMTRKECHKRNDEKVHQMNVELENEQKEPEKWKETGTGSKKEMKT